MQHAPLPLSGDVTALVLPLPGLEQEEGDGLEEEKWRRDAHPCLLTCFPFHMLAHHSSLLHISPLSFSSFPI